MSPALQNSPNVSEFISSISSTSSILIPTHVIEFNFANQYILDIIKSNYLNKLPQHINIGYQKSFQSISLNDIDNGCLKPNAFLEFCKSINVSPEILYDEYYASVLSDFSDKMLKWRKINAFNQKKAAEILGVSPTDIYKWEKRLSYPSRKQFEKVKNLCCFL